MKIFIVHEEKYNEENPYIYTHVKEIKKICFKIEIKYERKKL